MLFDVQRVVHDKIYIYLNTLTCAFTLEYNGV